MSKLITLSATIRVPDENGEWTVEQLQKDTEKQLHGIAHTFKAYVVGPGLVVEVSDEMVNDLAAIYRELKQ